MAGIAKITDVDKPPVEAVDATGAVNVLMPCDHLLVTVDVHSNGLVISNIKLMFADYAGLEAEWDAQVATTVLEAAVTTHMNIGATALNPKMSAVQKAVIGYNVAIA